MQDFWVAFAEDPVHGLPKLGWNAYQPGGEAVLLAVGDSTVQGIEESELGAPGNVRGPRRVAFVSGNVGHDTTAV